MRLVLQRVTRASVSVDGAVVGSIGQGLLCLVGISVGDTDPAVAIDWAKRKILGIRLWEDSGKAWAKSVTALGLEVLLVSQFTLYCQLKGHKPDFHNAMPPEPANEFWSKFVTAMSAAHPGKVQQGQFGAKMDVELVNDGPVTIELESRAPPAAAPGPLAAPAEPRAPAPLLLLLRAQGGSFGFGGLRECERRGVRIVAAKTVPDGGDGQPSLAVLLSGASAATLERTLKLGGGGEDLSVQEGETAIARFFAKSERCSWHE